jgi:alkanesulfonate monooxygenase SsuD/methylene tetrahydromethanopterin reductase-like flavin-dependent oxidoreductase (luciferase family)
MVAMTTRYGYFLSSEEHPPQESEEHPPQELVRQEKLAEEAGFEALWISDHFHPWLDEQGHSGHVWSVIGLRDLFSGQLISHQGQHYTVDTARLYSLPDTPPQIYMSGFGGKAIGVAARIADGYVCAAESRLRPAVPRVGRW